MKQLKNMKETLISATQAQLANLQTVNTEELGCAIDMIKDLSEAIYYCEIVESMKKAEEQQSHNTEPMMYFRERYPYYPERDVDRPQNRMYYSEWNGAKTTSTADHNKRSSSQEFEYSPNPYEGKSPERRRTYMETHHMNDKNANMKELEKYVQDLASDVVEMMQDATPEEKQMLSKKLNILSTKIQEV